MCPAIYPGNTWATGIMRYLIWVSRRYISLECWWNGLFSWFPFLHPCRPVIYRNFYWRSLGTRANSISSFSHLSSLSSFPLLPPIFLSPFLFSRCNLFFRVNFHASGVARLLLHSPTTITSIRRRWRKKDEEREKETERKGERERESTARETLYRRPVEFSIFLKAP